MKLMILTEHDGLTKEKIVEYVQNILVHRGGLSQENADKIIRGVRVRVKNKDPDSEATMVTIFKVIE